MFTSALTWIWTKHMRREFQTAREHEDLRRDGGEQGAVNMTRRKPEKFPGLFCAKLEPWAYSNQYKVHLPEANIK